MTFLLYLMCDISIVFLTCDYLFADLLVSGVMFFVLSLCYLVDYFAFLQFFVEGNFLQRFALT